MSQLVRVQLGNLRTQLNTVLEDPNKRIHSTKFLRLKGVFANLKTRWEYRCFNLSILNSQYGTWWRHISCFIKSDLLFWQLFDSCQNLLGVDKAHGTLSQLRISESFQSPEAEWDRAIYLSTDKRAVYFRLLYLNTTLCSVD